MDPISLVINVVRACDAIHTAVLQARCNQAQCALLDRRLQAIRPAIERVRTALETSYAGGTGVLSGDEQALVLSLVSFDEVVRAARTCIESFSGDSWGQRAWKLINREGFQMEFHQLNDRLTQAAGDLQLHFAALAHYATPPATNALEEGLRLGNSDDQQAAASEDLKQLRGQLSQIAEQVAAADEAAEERAHVVVHKLESAEEVAKRRHDSVRSHLSQLESALAMLVRQAQQGSSSHSASSESTLSPRSILPASVPPSPTVKKARQKLTAEDLQELEIPASDILLQEQIGSGGFGDVYRGQWVSRDMQVAVKKLRISNLSTQAHSDLMREVTLLRRTRLPTVVALLGIVRTEASQSFMLVLEYMNLGSLWDVLRKPAPTNEMDERQTIGHSVADGADASVQATQRGIPFGKSMPLEQRLHLMYSACLSVSHLHLSVPPIMHCDIKSLNFLLSLKGGSGSSALELKVADFGMSRTKRETTIQSTRGDVTTNGGNPQGGSLMWKAPERFRGFGAFTFACDVYSLAIVMWEIATGDTPYAESSDDEIRVNVKAGERMELPADMHPPLAELIKRMWAQEPKTRPTAREAAQALAKMRRAVMAEAKTKAAGSTLPSPSASVPFATSPSQGDSPFSFSSASDAASSPPPSSQVSCSSRSFRASQSSSSTVGVITSSSSSSSSSAVSVLSTSSASSSIAEPGALATRVSPSLSASPPSGRRRRQHAGASTGPSSTESSSSEPGAALKSPRRRLGQLSVITGDAATSLQPPSGMVVPAARPGGVGDSDEGAPVAVAVLEADGQGAVLNGEGGYVPCDAFGGGASSRSSDDLLFLSSSSDSPSSLPSRRDWSLAYASSGDYVYVCTALWGSTGDLDSDLAQPAMISFDSAAQQLLLVDAQQRNEQVQIWSANGSALQRWGRLFPATPGVIDDLQQPTGVVQDSVAKLCFVSDAAAGDIRVYSSETGELLRKFGRDKEWPEAQRLYCPTQLAVDTSSRHLFVVEFYAHRVQCFTYEGAFVTCWGGQMAPLSSMPFSPSKANTSLIAVAEETDPSHAHRAAATATVGSRVGGGGEKLFRGPSSVAILSALPESQRHASDVNRAQPMLFVGDSTGVVQIFSASRSGVKIGSLPARLAEKIASIAVVSHAYSDDGDRSTSDPNATALILDNGGVLRMFVRHAGAPSSLSRSGTAKLGASHPQEGERWSCIRQFPMEARVVTLDAETGRIYTLNELAVRIEVFDLQRMGTGMGQSNQVTAAVTGVPDARSVLSSSRSSSSLALSKSHAPLAQKLLEYSTNQESPLSPSVVVGVQLRGNHPSARAASLSRSPSNPVLQGSSAAAAAELPEWRSDSHLLNGQYDYFLRALFACRGSAGGEVPGMASTPDRIRLASPVCVAVQPGISSLVAIVDPANKRTAVMATNGAGCIMLTTASGKRKPPVPVAAAWAYNAPNLLFVLVMQQQTGEGGSGWHPLLQLWKCGSSSGSLLVQQKLDGWCWSRDTFSALSHAANSGVVPTMPCSFAVHPTEELVSIADYAAGCVRIHRMDGSLHATCTSTLSPSVSGAVSGKVCAVLAVSEQVVLLLLEDGRVRTVRWSQPTEVLAELHCSDLLLTSSTADASGNGTHRAGAVSFSSPRAGDAFPSSFMSLSACSPPVRDEDADAPGPGVTRPFLALVFLPRVRMAGLLEVKSQGRSLRWMGALPLPRGTLCVGFSCARGTLLTVQRTGAREMRAISWSLGSRVDSRTSATAAAAAAGDTDGGDTASSIRPILIAAAPRNDNAAVFPSPVPPSSAVFPGATVVSPILTVTPRRRVRGGAGGGERRDEESDARVSLANSTQLTTPSASTTTKRAGAIEMSSTEVSMSQSTLSKPAVASRRRPTKTTEAQPALPSPPAPAAVPSESAAAAPVKPSRRQKKIAQLQPSVVVVNGDVALPALPQGVAPPGTSSLGVQQSTPVVGTLLQPDPPLLPAVFVSAQPPSSIAASPAAASRTARGVATFVPRAPNAAVSAEVQSEEEAGFNRPAWLQSPEQLPAIVDTPAADPLGVEAPDSPLSPRPPAPSLSPRPPQHGRRARRQRQAQQEVAPTLRGKESAAEDSTVYAGGARTLVAKRNQEQVQLDQQAQAQSAAVPIGVAVGLGVVGTGALFAAGMRLQPAAVQHATMQTALNGIAVPLGAVQAGFAHSLGAVQAGAARAANSLAPAAGGITDGARSLVSGAAGVANNGAQVASASVSASVGALSPVGSSALSAVGGVGSSVVSAAGSAGSSALSAVTPGVLRLFGPGGVTSAGLSAAHGAAGAAVSAAADSALLAHARNGADTAIAGATAGIGQACAIQ